MARPLGFQNSGPGASTAPSSGSSWGQPGHGSTFAAGQGNFTAGGGGGSYGSKGARNKAARKYMEQAATLGLQISAVQDALGGEFKSALKRRLRNVKRVSGTSEDLLTDAYNERVAELKKSEADNEAAAGTQSQANLTNAARERGNAMTQAALQGAGESDLLQSQQMSLRNWSQNQNDITRAAADTATSIQGSLTDVTADTRTARANNVIAANADREALWNDYYDQREQALTQIGNLYGQQAELYGYADEAKGRKSTRRALRKAQRKSGRAFDRAADMAGEAWKNPGVGPEITGWPGADPMDDNPVPSRTLNSSSLSDAPTAPSGASLRKW